MKKTVLAVLGILVLAALLVVVPAVVAQTDIPAPVAAFNTAFNAGNVDAALATFTPDAVVTPPSGDYLNTPGLIKSWLQASANAKLTYTPIAGSVKTSGDTVTWQAKGSTGPDQLVTAKITNNKISSLTFKAAPTATPTGAAGAAAGAAGTPAAASAAAAATPAVGAASAANATPSALPTTGAVESNGGFPIIWAVLGGLIIAGGLAMRYRRSRA